MKAANNLGKEGVPKPVTGSHPAVAAKPFVPQPGLSPVVISLNALGLAYRVGLMKPTGAFLAAILALLIRVIMLAKTGAEVEVPSSTDSTPLVMV